MVGASNNSRATDRDTPATQSPTPPRTPPRDDWNQLNEEWAAAAAGAYLSRQAEIIPSMIAKAFADGGLQSHDGKEGFAIVDVGCGPGDFLQRCATALPSSTALVGLDLNRDFVRLTASKLREAGCGERMAVVRGDATDLRSELTRDAAAATQLAAASRVCYCSTGNTLGILPPAVRIGCVREMLLLARPCDVVLLHLFDAGDMESHGFPEFYAQNAALTGMPVERRHFDFKRGVLDVVESGYTSQWFDHERAQCLFDDALRAAQAEAPAVGAAFTFQHHSHGLYAVGKVQDTHAH
jgi:SAM-dependent methyltransferase